MYKIEKGKKINDAEIRSLQIDILKDIANFCDKNNINYFLSEGTLLGAVRHNGFIPWDDDVDIGMMREDYDKFIKKYKSKRYKFLCSEKIDGYYYCFGKVVDTKTKVIENNVIGLKDMGLWVDVFPYNYLSNNKIINSIKMFKIKIYNKILFYCRINKNTLIKRGAFKLKNRILFKLFNNNKKVINYCTRKLSNIGVKKETKYVGTCKRKLIFPNYFKEFINHKFEGSNFKIIKEYDNYLTDRYGNYMELPPEEERTKRHNYDVFWR